MVDNLKNILITGDTECGGISLLLKLLGDGCRVKVLDRYIYNYNDANAAAHKGAGFRYCADLMLIEGSTDDIKLLKESITETPFSAAYNMSKFNGSKCETVVYLAFSCGKSKKFNNSYVLKQVLKDCGVKRFLYISSCNTDDTELVELKVSIGEMIDDDFVAIIIQPSAVNGYFSRFLGNVDIHVTRNKIVHNGKIRLFNFKNEISRQYVDSMPDIVSYFLSYPIETIEKDLAANTSTYRCLFNRVWFFKKLREHKKNIIHATIMRFLFALKPVKRLFDVFMMMVLLHVWPERVNRFSTRKLLYGKAQKYSKESFFHHAYEFMESESSNIRKVKELNVIIRGESFDLKRLKDMKSPTYLACLGNPISNSKDYIYVTSRQKAAYFKGLGHRIMIVKPYITDCDGNCRLHEEISLESTVNEREKAINRKIAHETSDCGHIAIHEKIFRPPIRNSLTSWAPVGSGLPSVYALSFIAEKINVYGWDFRMTSSPENMNYLQVLLGLYQYTTDKITQYQLESAFINFYYGYHLSRMPNINIYGYLGHLEKHEKLISRIERVLFNCG